MLNAIAWHSLASAAAMACHACRQRNMAHLIAQSAVQPGVGTALGKVGAVRGACVLVCIAVTPWLPA